MEIQLSITALRNKGWSERRIAREPGQEAQIDYGTLYLPIGENRRLKKTHVLLVTRRLNNSRCILTY